jgi:hypothetical protein
MLVRSWWWLMRLPLKRQTLDRARGPTMFGFLKRKTKEPQRPDFSEIREMLFGDVPLDTYSRVDGPAANSDPWLAFAEARAALEINDTAAAVAPLRRVANAPNQESRTYLQAWHYLRQHGIKPEQCEAKRVLGVVLEMQLPDGLDTLAAYADHTARYINRGGKLIVWEAPEPSLNHQIDRLIAAGQTVADIIGPWEEPRRGPPPKGHIRLNMLTISGLHFGEGTWSALSNDRMGGPVIAAGTELMTALIRRVA